MAKNRQVMILSMIFILAAITGYIPWFIKLTRGNMIIRKFYIEIHDKLALILFVFFVLHVVKRLKWFVSTLRKLKLSELSNTMFKHFVRTTYTFLSIC